MTNHSVDKAVEESQSQAATRRANGEFVRGVSGFRNAIGDAQFPAESGRYHMFVALNCPWCHRVILARSVLGLQDSISVDIAFPSRTGEDDAAGPNLWEFNPTRIATLTGGTFPECTLETGTGKGYRLVKEIYAAENSSEGSVPLLYDKISRCIVNNESAEIVRMLNQFAKQLGSAIDDDVRPILYSETQALNFEFEELNTLIYTTINNGAYKAGFSSDQAVYASAFKAYFASLAQLEARLGSDKRPFLMGDEFTEVDLRLFPTLYRHDPVYYLRMNLNGAKMFNYPNLWRWLCRVYAVPGVAESSSLDHCKQGYFGRSWNNVVPLGPMYPMPYPEAYQHPELA